MLNQFSRTQLLIGADAIKKLSESRVAVFGIGGVGGYVCEALVRSGIGHFDLITKYIEKDVVFTNLELCYRVCLLTSQHTVHHYKRRTLGYKTGDRDIPKIHADITRL